MLKHPQPFWRSANVRFYVSKVVNSKLLPFGMLHSLGQDPGVSIIMIGLMVKTAGFTETPLCFHLIKSYHIPESSKFHNIPNLSFDQKQQLSCDF